jgi:Asp-tRNA(Asn)/Glu-tRNA(Gln) amidotransferase A subunit family amidase
MPLDPVPPYAATVAHHRRELAAAVAAFRSGSLDPPRYAALLAERVATLDAPLAAFVGETADQRLDRLTREATALVARHPDPATRPALFGLPFAVKDAYRTAGLPMRVGTRLDPAFCATLAFAGDPARPAVDPTGTEADAVALLRAAGGLVLGLAVSTELTFFAPGPTRNPWRHDHTPGGSSSGSAAAVGAGLCPLALGTQTIGSIVRPAAFCGAVGWKPTYERISRRGLVPLSPATDHVGVIVADVATAVEAAAALCPDWRGLPRGRTDRSADRRLDRPVLGVPRGPFLEAAGAIARDHLAAVVARLEAAGWEVREAPTLADFPAVAARHRRLLAGEVARIHPWIATHRGALDPRTVGLWELGQTVDDAELAALRAARSTLRAALAADAARSGIDLWLTPAAPGPAPAGLDATGDPAMNLPWTQAGLPAVGIPAGFSADGLPLGVQLVGAHGTDEELLAAALAVEAAVSPFAATSPGGER